jgi:hypothetical protein
MTRIRNFHMYITVKAVLRMENVRTRIWHKKFSPLTLIENNTQSNFTAWEVCLAQNDDRDEIP